LISTISVYGLLGVGLLVALLIVPGMGDQEGALASSTVGQGLLAFGFGGGFLLAVILARDTASSLEVEQNVKLASAFIGNAGGYLVLGLLTIFGATSSSSDLGLSSSGFGGSGGFSVGVGDFLMPLLLVTIFVGIIGAATVYVEDYF
jgi:hypothetical protein